MGVILPVVETEFKERSPYYSPMGTSFWIDSSISSFKQALNLLGKLSELNLKFIGSELPSYFRAYITKSLMVDSC